MKLASDAQILGMNGWLCIEELEQKKYLGPYFPMGSFCKVLPCTDLYMFSLLLLANKIPRFERV